MWQYIILCFFLGQVLLPPNARHHFTKRTCPPLKKKGKKQPHVWNINVSTQRWFWERFGALSGCFWEFLGVSSRLFGASRSTKEGLEIRLGTLFGLLRSLLAAKDGLGSVDVVFYLPSEPLGIDSKLSHWPSNSRKWWFYKRNPYIFEKINIFEYIHQIELPNLRFLPPLPTHVGDFSPGILAWLDTIRSWTQWSFRTM